MLSKLIKYIPGWEECDLSAYTTAFEQFGGNTLCNPKILDYISEHYNTNNRYFIHRNSDAVCDSALCSWGGKIAGDRKLAKEHNINIPIAFDELIFPHAETTRNLIIPFATKNLSSKCSNSVLNGSSKINADRELCIVKSITGKSRQTLNRQTNLFLKGGGQVHSIQEVGYDKFYDIYSELFFKRRNKQAEQIQTRHFLNHFNEILFGSYLSLNGKPCAAQVITKTEDISTIYLDYINSGRDTSQNEFSLGSICMWENIKSAFDYAASQNKELRFNFGPPTHKYKDRFCIRHKLIRVIA